MKFVGMNQVDNFLSRTDGISNVSTMDQTLLFSRDVILEKNIYVRCNNARYNLLNTITKRDRSGICIPVGIRNFWNLFQEC